MVKSENCICGVFEETQRKPHEMCGAAALDISEHTCGITTQEHKAVIDKRMHLEMGCFNPYMEDIFPSDFLTSQTKNMMHECSELTSDLH